LQDYRTKLPVETLLTLTQNGDGDECPNPKLRMSYRRVLTGVLQSVGFYRYTRIASDLFEKKVVGLMQNEAMNLSVGLEAAR